MASLQILLYRSGQIRLHVEIAGDSQAMEHAANGSASVSNHQNKHHYHVNAVNTAEQLFFYRLLPEAFAEVHSFLVHGGLAQCLQQFESLAFYI